MQSRGPESASPMTHRVQSLSSADTRGKHRIHAELKRLEQEARFLEQAPLDRKDQNVFGHAWEAASFHALYTPCSRLKLIVRTCVMRTRGMVGKAAGKAAYPVSSTCSKGFWYLIYGSLARILPSSFTIPMLEELEKLERMEKASTACKGMLSNVETKPDPLLPSTIGPVSPTWDRWFEGPQDSKGCCRCWIL
ncbi:hypothetical protein ACSQ67_014488 [Phaseolus vulgaris]